MKASAITTIFRGFDAESLQLFVAAVETQSLSKAAQLLGISQPAASRRLHLLERALGCKLLDRTPNGSFPTAEGQRILASASVALDALREVHNAAKGASEPNASIRVLASPLLADQLLPRWLSAVDVNGPRVSVDVRNSPEVLERLVAGQADLGLLCVPEIEPLLRDTGLSARPLAREQLCVAVHPKHPWARPRRAVSISDVANTELVEREPQSQTRAYIERILSLHREAGPPRPVVELSSTTALKTSVLDGAGPAVLGALSIVDELDANRLVEVPVDGFDVERVLYAVWPPSSDERHDVMRLVSAAEQVASAASDASQAARARARARRTGTTTIAE